MYHKIAADAPTMWWVSADVFYRQMWELQSKKVVYLNDYNPNDPSSVCITFDGVYENVYKFAAPILEHFGYAYELFVVGDSIGQNNTFDTGEPLTRFADIDQLREMVTRGGRLQWHTRTHRRLTAEVSLENVREELKVPNSLREIDPAGFRWIAYPHGEFSAVAIEEARKVFGGGVSCHQGNGRDLFELNRTTAIEVTTFQRRSIGVVIPSYNYGRFLAEAAESVLRQTILPNRILIIDDASEDDTQMLGRALEQAHSHLISFYRNDVNLGIVRTFNKAIEMIDTDYVLFLGADNRFAANYVEICAECLDKDASVGIAYTDFALFGSRAPIVYGQFPASQRGKVVEDTFWLIHFPENPEDVRQAMIGGGENMIHGSSMFRVEAWAKSGGYRHAGDIPEDFDLFRRMLANGWKTAKARSTQLEYRQHSTAQANVTLQTNASFRALKDAVRSSQEAARASEQQSQRQLAELEKVRERLVQTNQQLAQTNQQLAQTNQQLVQTNQQLAQTNRLVHSKSVRLAESEAQIAQLTANLRRQLQTTKKFAGFIGEFSDAAARLRSSRRWQIANPIAVLRAKFSRDGRSVGYGHLEKIVSSYNRWHASHPETDEIDDQIQALTIPFVRRGQGPADPAEPIRFPIFEKVDVSIIIPVFNQFHFTQACLASLQQHLDEQALEVIVVDDGSTDETIKSVPLIEGVVYLRSPSNAGFIASCNLGAAKARGKYLLFLNNDTVATRGWLSALLETFQDEPKAGLVGSKLTFPDGRLQEAGGIIWNDASGWNYGKFDDPGKPEYNFLREVDYCSAACVMIPKALFESVGGFDMQYAPGYYEDTDLSFKVRRSGYKVLYQPLSEVIHFEGATGGTDLSAGAKRHQEVNRVTFAKTWADALAGKPANGDLAAYFRCKPGQKRILVIDHHLPMPERDSGSLRMFQILTILHTLGHRVTFIPDGLADILPFSSDLRKRGIEVVCHPYIKSVREHLREHGNNYDVVVLSRRDFARKHIEDVRQYAPTSRIVFDTVDLHFVRDSREAELTQDPKVRMKAEEKKEHEYALIDAADETWVVSSLERQLLQERRPEKQIEVVTNIVEVPGSATPFSLRRDWLFIGSFQHTPNVDAVIYFVQEIYPLLRDRLSRAKFYVIGDKAPPSVVRLASENVIIAGLQPDVRPYFDRVRLSVAPLRWGAGVKGKINQSMGFGVPVVATSMAVEGMELQDREDVLVADEPEAFADALVELYESEELWNHLSQNGIEKTRSLYSVDTAREKLRRLFGNNERLSSVAPGATDESAGMVANSLMPGTIASSGE